MRRIVLYFFCLGILSTLSGFVGTTTVASAEPYKNKITVLSSIKPVQMIVFAIAGEHIESEQLIPDYISPHDYSFKPSDIRKIKRADLIFRIDEHFETVLEVTLKSVFESSQYKPQVISLAENPNIKILPVAGGHKHGGGHDHEDLHVFTSPLSALFMAEEIADELIKMDRNNASFYQKNLQAFRLSIVGEVERLHLKLKAVKDKPFIVFHPSWQYFGDYFGLQKPHIINMHEGVSSGVKSLITARKAIASNKIRCVFSNSEISLKRINALTENLKVKTTKIDVMGRDFALSKNSYVQWFGTMGDKVADCLE
jgi:zinc transport system substrate-binding protein